MTTEQTKNARDWLNRLRKLDVHFDEFIRGNMHALSESHLTILSELGTVAEDIDTGTCLSALARASGCVLALNDEWLGAFERSCAPLDPGSPRAIKTLISTMQRCGYSPDLQKAVVRLVGGELDAASGPENITSGDVKAELAEQEKPVGPPPEPIVFKSQEELTDFVVTMWPKVNARAHEVAQAKNDASLKAFKERQALKRELLGPGEIYVDEQFLRDALSCVEEILERLPDLDGNDLMGEVNEAAIKAWSRLFVALRWGSVPEEDLDTSDNESGEAAQ